MSPPFADTAVAEPAGQDFPMPAVLRCTGCGQTKPLWAFHRNVHHWHGHRSRCRVCTREERAEQYARLKATRAMASR